MLRPCESERTPLLGTTARALSFARASSAVLLLLARSAVRGASTSACVLASGGLACLCHNEHTFENYRFFCFLVEVFLQLPANSRAALVLHFAFFSIGSSLPAELQRVFCAFVRFGITIYREKVRTRDHYGITPVGSRANDHATLLLRTHQLPWHMGTERARNASRKRAGATRDGSQHVSHHLLSCLGMMVLTKAAASRSLPAFERVSTGRDMPSMPGSDITRAAFSFLMPRVDSEPTMKSRW